MPTQTSLLSRRVLFHPDGEAIDRTDDENVQLFSRQELWNVLFSGSMADGIGMPDAPGAIATPEAQSQNDVGIDYLSAVMAPWPGAGGIVPTPTVRTIVFLAGPILMAVDEPWSYGNNGEEFALYRVGGGITLQTAVGDGTHPRIDLVEVRLQYVDGDLQTRHFEDATTRAPSSQPSTPKERQVEFSYQIKQGTPAANPVYPTPTTGYQAMAAIYVPATHAVAHSADNIRDLRIPFGCRAYDVPARLMVPMGTNPWTPLGLQMIAAGSSDPDADRLIALCPVGARSSRLLAVGIHGKPGSDPRFELCRLSWPSGSSGAPTVTTIADLSTYAFNADGFTFCDAMRIADEIDNAGVIKGERAANTRVGTPIWCNGRTAGMAAIGDQSGAEAPVYSLALSIGGENASDARVGFVRFWVAEGL